MNVNDQIRERTCSSNLLELFKLKFKKKEFDDIFNVLKKCKLPMEESVQLIFDEKLSVLATLYAREELSNLDYEEETEILEPDFYLEILRQETYQSKMYGKVSDEHRWEFDLSAKPNIDTCGITGEEMRGNLSLERLVKLIFCIEEHPKQVDLVTLEVQSYLYDF